jgi:hypothetical protein
MEAMGDIHVEHSNSCPTTWCQTRQLGAVPAKVPPPPLAARIEQNNNAASQNVTAA